MTNPYAALADVGIKAITGIASGVLADAQVNAANTVNTANAYASNLVRSANNRLGAARQSLARYNIAENNNRLLQSTGAEADVALVNYRRARDSATQDDFESQIRFSEQAGAQAAASALSGLSGGVADIVASTTALRKARIQQRTDEAMKQSDLDAAQRQAAITRAGWDSLDHSEISPDLDYSVDVAVQQFRGGNLLMDALSKQDSKSLANVAGFFQSDPFDAFADRAGAVGTGSGGRQRAITGGR